jgi:hypothetical protein
VRVRLAARLLYCFGCGASWADVDVDVASGRLVGHTAGHVEMCSCSPWAMRLYLAVVPCQPIPIIKIESSFDAQKKKPIATTNSTTACKVNNPKETAY